MNRLLILFLTLISFNLSAGEYYRDFKDHPNFQSRLKAIMGSYEPLGRPFVKLTSMFGEGYDQWAEYIYVQEIKPEIPKTAVVLKVTTQGIVLDCGLGSNDEDMGELIKKYCGFFDEFVELIEKVSVIEIK